MSDNLTMADEQLAPEIILVDPDDATDSVVQRLDGLGVPLRVLEEPSSYRSSGSVSTAQVLLLGPGVNPSRARGVVSAARATGSTTRVIRIASDAVVPVSFGAGFTDAIVHPPVTTEALAAAMGLASKAADLPEVDTVELVRLSSLTGSLDVAMQHAVEVVRDAFHADAAVILKGADLWSEGLVAQSADAHAAIAARILRSADEAAVVVGGPMALASDLHGFESFDAAAIVGDGGRRAGVIGIIQRGFRALGAEQRGLLTSLGKRFGRELELRAAQRRLVAEIDASRDVGGLDPLTGAWSEATMLRLLEMLMSASRRTQVALTVAVLDLRGLEKLNQQGGHTAGDEALKVLIDVVTGAVRDHDVVARYRGGVALVLPGATAADAVGVARRIQQKVADARLAAPAGQGTALQVRVGIAEADASSTGAEGLLARARQAARAARGAPEMLAMAPSGVVTRPEGKTLPQPSTTGQVQRAAGDVPVSYNTDLTGMTLGGSYRLLHRIASGGGGTVYRGEDLGLRRPVAVKLLSPELAHDEAALRRFRNEAATLAAISHPNLVQVYAFGVDRGFSFFVMELVEGESVEGALRRCARESRTIPPTRVMRIVEDVASALDVLHGFSVLHRDVKPANVLLDPFRNRAVIVDVGVARRRESSDRYLAGTPAYMAPEVFLGGEVGPGVDVFGLAATVYEMITLHDPWPESDTVQEALHVRSLLPPTPVSSHCPEFAAVDPVLERGLHADPTERYRSAKEFARDFVAALRTALGSTKAPTGEEGVTSSRMRTGPPPQWEAERSDAHTRLVVFRSFASVLGAKQLARWRSELARTDARLAQALSASTPPLGWYPTETLIELIESCPRKGGVCETGRELGRAAVRATFRRFFPASAATLTPQSTITALPRIWEQYHGWGSLEISSDEQARATVTVTSAMQSEALRGLTAGMLEQLLLLSGAREVSVELPGSQASSGACCRVELSWK